MLLEYKDTLDVDVRSVPGSSIYSFHLIGTMKLIDGTTAHFSTRNDIQYITYTRKKRTGRQDMFDARTTVSFRVAQCEIKDRRLNRKQWPVGLSRGLDLFLDRVLIDFVTQLNESSYGNIKIDWS